MSDKPIVGRIGQLTTAAYNKGYAIGSGDEGYYQRAISALRKRVEELAKDAARYRWLRDRSPETWKLTVDALPCWKFDYDAAIDTAMSRQEEEG